MPDLLKLWRFLEARPTAAAVPAEWRARVGDDFADIDSLISPSGMDATCYPNPRGRGLPLDIVRYPDGAIAAVSTDGGPQLKLNPSDIELHKASFPAMRKILAKALSLQTSHESIPAPAKLFRVGLWEPKPAAAYSVFLAIAESPAELSAAVHSAARDARKPCIVLTPTRVRWTDDTDAVAASVKAVLAPLDEIVQMNSGGLAATAAWQEYLSGFCRQADLKFTSSFTNKRPPRKRAGFAAKIELLRNELIKHIKSAKDAAHTAVQADLEPKLLPRPKKMDLGKRVDLKPYDVTRCFQDDSGLRQLWRFAGNLHDVMRWGK